MSSKRKRATIAARVEKVLLQIGKGKLPRLRVQCNRRLHTLQFVGGDLCLPHHPRGTWEDDQAMAALAGHKRPLRCFRVLKAWQTYKQNGNYSTELPYSLVALYRALTVAKLTERVDEKAGSFNKEGSYLTVADACKAAIVRRLFRQELFKCDKFWIPLCKVAFPDRKYSSITDTDKDTLMCRIVVDTLPKQSLRKYYKTHDMQPHIWALHVSNRAYIMSQATIPNYAKSVHAHLNFDNWYNDVYKNGIAVVDGLPVLSVSVMYLGETGTEFIGTVEEMRVNGFSRSRSVKIFRPKVKVWWKFWQRQIHGDGVTWHLEYKD